MFPVNAADEPDCGHVEQYAKNMMLRKYRRYLSFLNREAETDPRKWVRPAFPAGLFTVSPC